MIWVMDFMIRLLARAIVGTFMVSVVAVLWVIGLWAFRNIAGSSSTRLRK